MFPFFNSLTHSDCFYDWYPSLPDAEIYLFISTSRYYPGRFGYSFHALLTRCTIPGWGLAALEAARIAGLDDAEVVLQERPMLIKARIVLGRGTHAETLILKPRVREWARDASGLNVLASHSYRTSAERCMATVGQP